MLFHEVEATVSGVNLVFYAHFFSDTKGSIQIVGWTGKNLIDEARKTIENFVAEYEVKSR